LYRFLHQPVERKNWRNVWKSETTTGGNALKFYASVRLDIRRASQIKDGENVIGNRTKVKL
jgi:RecA/RadA recombinase